MRTYKNDEKRRLARQRYYDANKASVKAGVNRQGRKARAFLREVIRGLKTKPCMDCGGTFPPYVMQFDHVRGTKEFEIADGINRGSGMALKRLLAEVQKCELVCANCHAIRSYERKQHLGLPASDSGPVETDPQADLFGPGDLIDATRRT